ncbi:DUF1364 family protein [Devosia algicola]|uniref:DUF1364 family protein n=1 Tax=Devosia algicola TaxID=3026418 RepID=A0ABY7YR53_9HYPH|nr:nuclease domain-containing protein [Devosia algicola]WDR03662.1 DUF1364 family protein [Devosia algicola]
MSELRQRREPIRAPKLMAGAKGQPCDLNFAGVCNYDPATTVSCHVHDESFGAAQKADDTATIHGCSACHAFLDHGWVGKVEWAVVQFHIIRGLLRTFRNRADRGLIIVPVTIEKPASQRPPKPRKPPQQRTKINGRNDWPVGRKISSKPFQREKS